MKLLTPVEVRTPDIRIGLSDPTMVLGSCFALSVGQKMADAGFRVCTNPFGPLYNPLSVEKAVRRLDSCILFGPQDCVPMGAGALKICSFEHHTSFARDSREEFLACANAALSEACAFWKTATRVIVTFGTARVWKRNGEAVSNCLKRPGTEFTRESMTPGEIAGVVDRLQSSHPQKRFIFTVSPIRHLSEGAHANSLSKAALLLGIEQALHPESEYFPSYEILLDELRDYRFFADDLCHPSSLAKEIVWERFRDAFVPAGDIPAMEEALRQTALKNHRNILTRQ